MMKFQYTQVRRNDIRVFRFSQYATPEFLHVWLEHLEGYQQDSAHYSVVLCPQEDPTSTEQNSITLNGRSFMIPIALRKALSAIVEHHNSGESYWADAVCINHGDPLEKTELVPRTGEILTSADHVLLWIGDEDSETATAFAALRQRADSCPYPSLEECSRGTEHRVVQSEDQAATVQSLLHSDGFRKSENWPNIIRMKNVSLLSGRHQCDITLFHHYEWTSATNLQHPRQPGTTGSVL